MACFVGIACEISDKFSYLCSRYDGKDYNDYHYTAAGAHAPAAAVVSGLSVDS